MATVYGRIAKISNVVGRSDYLNDEKRQEKIVLQKKVKTDINNIKNI